MTKREAAIVAAYTGIMIGDFADMHEFIEEVMERPVFTHEMGNKEIAAQIKGASKPYFVEIEVV
jgi:hypothetical protein